MNTAVSAEVERLASDGWPAEEQVPFGEWVLRANSGVTRRANSVLTVGDAPCEPSEWFTRIASFYRERGIEPCYSVSDNSPPGVDDFLAERGYKIIYPCYQMVRTERSVGRADIRQTRPDFEIRLQPEADDRWLDDFLNLEGFPAERRTAFAGLFARMGPAKTFVTILADGKTAGIGTAVARFGWAAVYNIVTAPAWRRQGVARAVLGAIDGWAEAHGADRLLLQVVRDNTPAVTLYESLGFRLLTKQHYRVAPQS